MTVVTFSIRTNSTNTYTNNYSYLGVTKIKETVYAKQYTIQTRVYIVRDFRLPPLFK
jgi:hypothetical protein